MAITHNLSRPWNYVLYVGLTLLIIGWIYLVIKFIFFSETLAPSDIMSMGLSFIGIAFAVEALLMSIKTDKLVSKLSDLNFYEKIADMAGYILQLSELETNNDNTQKQVIEDQKITETTQKSINLLCFLHYNMKAISALQGQISAEQKKEFDNVILQSFVPVITTKELKIDNHPMEIQHIHEIKKLISQIYGDDPWKSTMKKSTDLYSETIPKKNIIPTWLANIGCVIYLGLIVLGLAIASLFGLGFWTISNNGNIAGLALGLSVTAWGWNLIVFQFNLMNKQ